MILPQPATRIKGERLVGGLTGTLKIPSGSHFTKQKIETFLPNLKTCNLQKRLFFYLVAKMIVRICMRIYLYIVESSPKNSSRVNLNGYLIQKQSPQILQGWVVPCGTHFWFIRSKFLSPSKPNQHGEDWNIC